ncbi:hypothetical protein GAYE_SCF23G4277 [Galdieria yellowstonensis]|uniref:Endo-beta-1,6-galactanase-like domain-containing protein n=1 Tax=Galdieria yellowstonensis TaxID=3028027 RepID=A0AAV9IGF8_9RHOD|nr:hypothetical protein GAYE_SCF23G4277 [Galdieria yellowstonensis]
MAHFKHSFASLLTFFFFAALVTAYNLNPGPYVGSDSLSLDPCLSECSSNDTINDCNHKCHCATEETVMIDATAKQQKFRGFGINLAWFAFVMGRAPESVRNQIADLLFDKENGLGLNVVRYEIPGGENPRFFFMHERERLPGYEPVPGVYDWSADEAQRWFLMAAIQRGVEIQEAMAYSPPYWMTYSGSTTGGPKGYPNFNINYKEQFVDYLVTVVKHFYEHFNVTFSTLEMFNEPLADYWTFGNRQEGCHIGLDTQQILIPILHKKLQEANIPTKIAAADDYSIDQTLFTVIAYNETGIIRDLHQVNTHTYAGNRRAQLHEAMLDVNKPLWVSEYGNGDNSGLITARHIMKDIQKLQPEVWCYWQGVDMAGSGWGPLEAHLNTVGDYSFYATPKYYTFGQFTKFLKPGSTFVSTSDPLTLAAIHENTLTLVTMNCGKVTFDVSSFSNMMYQEAQVWYSVPWKGLYFKKVGTFLVENGKITLELPVAGVSSIVIQ